MHIRGNKRPSLLAKSIFALIVLVAILATAYGIYGMDN